jgi:hypothetical protein
VLRTGLLTGRTIALAGTSTEIADALAAAGASHTTAAGARDALAVADPQGDGPARPDVLVADARDAFTAAGGGYDGLRAAVDGAFAAARDVAAEHWIDREGAGRLVLVAPAPGAGAHAGATAAGLENLARSLSTEWARHAVTTVAVLPGDATTEATLAGLVAWLASPAAAYLSGTALTLDRLA